MRKMGMKSVKLECRKRKVKILKYRGFIISKYVHEKKLTQRQLCAILEVRKDSNINNLFICVVQCHFNVEKSYRALILIHVLVLCNIKTKFNFKNVLDLK